MNNTMFDELFSQQKLISCMGKEKFVVLFDLLEKAPDNSICEIGVYKGGSANFMANYRERTGKDKTSKMILIDTFEGIPYKDDIDHPTALGAFADTSYESICNFFSPYKNTYIYKGLVEDYIKEYNKTTELFGESLKFSFVHIDVDVYEAHKVCFDFFYPRMVKGGIILLDDYDCPEWKGAKKATEEFCVKTGLKVINAGTQQGVIYV